MVVMRFFVTRLPSRICDLQRGKDEDREIDVYWDCSIIQLGSKWLTGGGGGGMQLTSDVQRFSTNSTLVL